MRTNAIVVGAGGFGREALDVVEAWNTAFPAALINVLGVVDDAPSDLNLQRLAARGYKHLGSIKQLLSEHASEKYIIGVGNPVVKRAIAAQLDAAGWQAVSVVHPTAVVSTAAEIAHGVIICGGVHLSTNTRLSRHVHVGANATVGHDAVLNEFVSINPGAIISGEVRLEPDVLVGAGAVVLQGLRVGANAIVGASACVVRDVKPCTTVVGVPARRLPKMETDD